MSSGKKIPSPHTKPAGYLATEGQYVLRPNGDGIIAGIPMPLWASRSMSRRSDGPSYPPVALGAVAELGREDRKKWRERAVISAKETGYTTPEPPAIGGPYAPPSLFRGVFT
jgi:hypothetical protein